MAKKLKTKLKGKDSTSTSTSKEDKLDDDFYQKSVKIHQKGSGTSARSGYFESYIDRMVNRYGATGDPLARPPETAITKTAPVTMLVPRKKVKK